LSRTLRLAAYRQFTWWIHSKLGRKVRRVIPACVVATIRAAFSEESEMYVGYKDGDTADDYGMEDEDEDEEQAGE
jgi:hypothetical protein